MTPDETHPFGHRGPKPVAGLMVAIFAGILSFEVCRTAITHLSTGELPKRIGPYPIVALCITLALNLGSPATSGDAENP